MASEDEDINANDILCRFKIITEQKVDKKLGSMTCDGQKYPWRRWSIYMVGVDDNGREFPLDFVKCVVYTLHESFDNQTREVSNPPFRLNEKAWGEFDIPTEITFRGAKSQLFPHVFAWSRGERYEEYHTMVIKNPSPILRQQVMKSMNFRKRSREEDDFDQDASEIHGDVSIKNDEFDIIGDDNDVNVASARKKPARPRGLPKQINMKELADRLENLTQDDLYEIVDLVNKYRTEDMYVKDDVQGEFTMDLYTLSDKLLQKLWSFTEKIKDM